MFNKLFNKLLKKNTNEDFKRSMTDDELNHLVGKIKHNLAIIEGLENAKEMRYYLTEISRWIDEIQKDDFKGYY